MAAPDLQSRLDALSPQQREQLKQLLAAKKAAAAAAVSESRSEAGIPRAAAREDYPLSFAQKRLWLQEQLSEGKSAAYNVSLAVTLRGELRLEALERAFRVVIGRHAVLRTLIVRRGDEVRQQILDTFEWSLQRWSAVAGADARTLFVERSEELANRPFALEKDLPLRVACMPLGTGEHGLVMVFHHIACDAHSVRLVVEDLQRYYAGALREESRPTIVPATRYVDYAVWHREWMESAAGAKAKDYWLKQFADIPEPIELPADRPRPAVQDFSGRHLHHRFAPATRERLAQVGQRSGASLFMTLLAAVATFVHRYTGRDDVTIGSPTAGRIHPQLDGLVGFFVNTVPLRVGLTPHEPFKAVLGRVRDGVLDAFEHQGCPFDVLVQALPLERDLSRPPLFNLMVGLTSAEDETFRLQDLDTKVVPLSLASSKADVTFHFVETANGLELDLEYATALFDEGRMRRLISYFETMLAAVIAAPETAVGDLGLWRWDDALARVRRFNPPLGNYPRDGGLVELFREQVRRDPKADAVAFDGRSFSYAEIDHRSDALARLLIQRLGGVRPEEAIALQVERSERMIVALLGILKAGGCYLPINPGTPVERVRMLLTMGRVRLRLTEGEVAVSDWGGVDVDLREWSALTATASVDPAAVPSGGAERLAYIIFTSGSTGEPKGVLIEQRSVVRLVCGTDFLQLGPGDRVLQTGSLAFDASTFEIWGPLLNGGCCCLPKGKEILEIEQFGELLRATGATTCFLTTGLFNQIADFHPEAFRGLRHLLTGGEKVSVPHVNRVRTAAPGLSLLHVYGPTENTTFSSWHPVRDEAGDDVPIGRAIAHSTLYVLDERGNLQPPGVAGEIYCGGDGIARGYLGRPELTAERFVPDPFSAQPGARLYRTGDYGCWDENGNVSFIGRRDDQVKIRGFRIELGEIELRLRALPGVQQAVVVARPAGGTHELVAYLVCAGKPAEETLRTSLGAVLPDYMVPAHFVLLDALPLNASGKVDRRALPAPQRSVREDGGAVDPSQWDRPGEAELAAVWAEVLGRAPTSRDTHYFYSGGDSIKAIQITARLRSRGYRLMLRDVFARPRFGELATALVRAEPDETETIAAEGEIPLTPIQRWFLETFQPPFDHFNQATLLEADGRLDPALLRRALDAVVQRHAMLRCRIERTNTGGWRQHVPAGPATLVWREEDFGALDGGAAQAALEATGQALHASLSLAEGRLVAAGFFRGRLADRLLLVIHHWAVDGISWRVLIEELEENYRALAGGTSLPERPAPTPFRAWSQALQRYAESDELELEVRYWQTVVGTKGEAQSEQCATISEPARTEVFSAELTDRIGAAATRAYGAQIEEVLLAALSRAWEERHGSESLLLALEGHGRESCVARSDVSGTVGWFTSMWPFRLEGRGDWAERIRGVKDALRSVPERGVGYGVLRYLRVDVEGKPAVPACSPRVSFNYLGVFGEGRGALFRGVVDEPTGEPVAEHLGSPFDLDVVAEISGGRLRVSFQFHRALGDGAEREALVEGFARALRESVEHCAIAAPRKSRADFTGGVATLEEFDRLERRVAMQGEEIEDVLPLTPMQEGMVFHAYYEPGGEAYADQVVIRLNGPLERERFEAAWQALGVQYSNLRTVFFTGETEKPVGVIVAGSRLGFAWVDVSDDATEARLQELRETERRRGFDLAVGPLLRATLIRIGPARHEVVLRFHHSLIDGWSSGLIWRALEGNYRALASGAELPRVASSFRDYLRWFQRRDAQADLAGWRKLLVGTRGGASVPTGRPRLGAPAVQTRSFAWELGRERSKAMVAAAHRLGTTESSLFQALWGVFLGKLNRTADVVFGATISGRSEQVPRVEEIVGLLINTIPVRVSWDERDSFETLAARVRVQAAEALERPGASLADIQNAVGAPGELVRHTLVFENYPEEDADGEARVWQTETAEVFDPMHFEFGVIVVPRKEGWLCRVVADAVRYPDAHLRALQQAWEHVVDASLGRPDALLESWRIPAALELGGRVVVAATFTAEPIESALTFWFEALGRDGEVRFAPFNQVLQQLLDPASDVSQNREGLNLILVRLEDWAGVAREDARAVEEALELNGDLFVDGLRRLGQAAPGARHLVMFCPASPQARHDGEFAKRMATAEARLARRIAAAGLGSVGVFRGDELAEHYATAEIDQPGGELGGVPYTEEFFAVLATEAFRRSDALARPPFKVLALDADNTLWRGVIGEDGADGIELTPAHRSLQEMAANARRAGWLVVLVSKNNLEDLREAFRAHRDFPLGWDDLVAVEAGWGTKSESLRRLARTLNLGLDSFVFIDDSGAECAEVRGALPEVLVLQLPAEQERIARFVRHCWPVDTVAATVEDRQRSELYRVEARREEVRQASGGLGEFIRQLQLEVVPVAIGADNLERAAQLTQRTNQFNASTKRRSVAELRTFLEGKGHRGRLFAVKDRFGDYGLTGCVLYRDAGDGWEIDTLLLSCRVLGRGVEHRVLRQLAAEAHAAGIATLRIPFGRSAKNAPAEQFLKACAHRAEERADGGTVFVFETTRTLELEVASNEAASPGEQPVAEKLVGATARGLPAASHFYEFVATRLASTEELVRAIADSRHRRVAGGEAPYEAPENERERRIAEIWAEVLGVERAGRRDDFFGLGGHSLKAVMMLSRVNRAFGTALPLDSIFESSVLADLARRSEMTDTTSGVVERIPRAPAAADYPLSAAQRRLWLIEQMRGPGPSPFHMPAVFTLRGTLEPPRLEKAFRGLIARHESLRTALVMRGGEPRQVVIAEVDFAIETLAVDGVAKFLERDFDFARPPLLRAGLVKRDEHTWTLAVVMHHLVSDGWSIGVMAEELSRLYRDDAVELGRLELQYKDYAVWQAERLAGDAAEGEAEYWRDRFADLPPPLELPADRVRPAVKQSHGAEVVELASATEWATVKRQAQAEGLSPFMAVLAAVQAVLARQAGARRFVIGTPVAGRDWPELEPQIGFYVNLLPLVSEVDGERTVREHLGRVKGTVTDALAHAAYPFDRLVNDLKLPRDTSRTPLFDVLLVFQSNRAAELSLGDVAIEAVEWKTRTSQYELTFDVAETSEGLRLRLEYDRALFDEARMMRLARQVVTALMRLMKSPERQLGVIEICPEEESARIRRFERGAAFGRYGARTLPEIVAAAEASRVAVVSRECALTYGELRERVAEVAQGIRRAGVRRQEPIAVAGERTEAFVVAMLGVMQAGCVYLPMDLKHPDERLRMVVEDGGVRHAIAIGDEAKARLRAVGLNVIEEGGDAQVVESERLTAEDLAYVIYTSGSTGRPKGVEITHGAFATMIEAQVEAFGVVPADRCAWWASCAFDASLSEMFLALATGATLVIAEERQREDTGAFLEWLRERRVTVITLPPAFLRVLRRVSLEPLRVLITAGEAADPGDARHYARRLNVFNAYGPTETSVCATVQSVAADGVEGASIPIGRPLAVASAYVLDAARRRVPIGVAGELFVGGRIVGRGYRNAPALTAERFLEDLFTGEAGARMYRTGDLVRWREDGALEFLGRDDGQVKIRGFRIELGEIEATLRSLEGVRDAAVIGVRRGSGTALAAYVVAEAGAGDRLREEIAARLPDYMRPSVYVFLERLPMTPNGKLDKAALPPAEEAGDENVTAPETSAERMLAAAWAGCLGCVGVGRESDFFALGGDSIKALDLSGRLSAAGWSLGLKEVYAYPRLQDMARELAPAKARRNRVVEGVAELTPIQKWFFEAHAGSPLHHFNQAVFYRAAERVDRGRLQRAVEAVWRRHAALRSVFVQTEEGWRQVFRFESVEAPNVGWFEESDAAAEANVNEWVQSLQGSFDLQAGPLVRYGVVRGRDGDRVLCITHHLVSDWISHRVLLEDLDRAYAAAGDGEIVLPPAVTELDEWVSEAVRSTRARTDRSALVEAWKRVAEEGREPSTLDAVGRYGDVAVRERTLGAEATVKLRRRAAEWGGGGVRDAIVAAVVRATREVFGRSTLALQLEGHGREGVSGVDVSRTVGWFTSLYPCVFRDGADENESAAVERVERTLAALPTPVESYGLLRAYGYAAEMPAVGTEIGFNYLGEFGGSVARGFFELAEDLPRGAIAADFERDHALDVTAWIVGGELHVMCAYLPEQRTEGEMNAWLDRIVDFLERVGSV